MQLVSTENVKISFGMNEVLSGVSVGISSGEHIGLVGLNGSGKSTLVKLLLNQIEPDSGRVAKNTKFRFGYSSQTENFPKNLTVREVLIKGREEFEFLSDRKNREIVEGLGLEPLLNNITEKLSGGQKQKLSIALALTTECDFIVLDEPTNHLDLVAIAWLANHLKTRKEAILVVTHDRWFLDEVADTMWEVVNHNVNISDGGYSDWVFARALRDQQAQTEFTKKANLARKELAWLRRGAPARTKKPRYRIQAAEELIATEPPVRDKTKLALFAQTRLGREAITLKNINLDIEDKPFFTNLDWNLIPGSRIGIVGANGSGKSTLLKVLSGENEIKSGHRKVGLTVRLGFVHQELVSLQNPKLAGFTVLDAIEEATGNTVVDDKEITPSQLANRLGFNPVMQKMKIKDLSGGQQRRLELTRILAAKPNVLILDEPTNDLDIEMLQQLEDLLDDWVGTLIIVSHDRHFLERTTDDVYTIDINENLRDLRHLPKGIEQFIQEISNPKNQINKQNSTEPKTENQLNREQQKEIKKLESSIEKNTKLLKDLEAKMTDSNTNYDELMQLSKEYDETKNLIETNEIRWLELQE